MPVSGGSDNNGVTVSSINAAFYMGDPATTNLSNITFYPTTNFASYFQFRVFPNLWLRNNAWNIPGKLEYSYISQETFGLGANSSKDSLNVISYNLFRISMSFNREILNHFFMGLGYAFDVYYNIDEQWDKDYPSNFELYNTGTSGRAISTGPVFTILYDNRKNSVNPLKGLYSNFTFRINREFLGSDFNWSSVYFETRKYVNFSSVRHSTLALRGIYWSTWGEVPYLSLPSTGYDFTGTTGRGYYRGRYRGKQMLYGEVEYRFDITRSGLWGGVVFANGQTYPEPETGKFSYIKPAVGFGGRLKFNKFSDSNITCDIAFGKDSFNYYITLNEAF
jgi:outer membrane protein assembly factor BamA